MVEVQVDHAPVVAAYRAGATGLLDEDALDLLEAPGHGLTGTALAAPAVPALALAAQVEGHEPVPAADTELAGAVCGRRAAAPLHEGYGWFRFHERMFAFSPDGETAIIGLRAVSSMAERGTSTQKER